MGMVYGSGFERQPETLDRLSEDVTVLGNNARTVKDVKDPAGFARSCEALGLPHPEICLDATPVSGTWVFKEHGGSGGSHVVPATDSMTAEAGYFQRIVPGRPVSALFASDGHAAQIIGFSEQWSDPTDEEPYRYGGAITPALLTDAQVAALSHAVHVLTQSFALRGLNSADFMVDGDAFHVLEINPRPGATLDIFDDDHGSLLQVHIAACTGKPVGKLPTSVDYRAAKIVYAADVIPCVPAISWPDWAADRQAPGSRVETGWPICTILARSDSRPDTLALLADREASITRQLGGP